MWTVPSLPDSRTYVKPSPPSSLSTNSRAIGSAALGRGATFANGSRNVFLDVFTSNAFLRLLWVTDRIFIATPRIQVLRSTRALVALRGPASVSYGPGPISRRVSRRGTRARAGEDDRLSR